MGMHNSDVWGVLGADRVVAAPVQQVEVVIIHKVRRIKDTLRRSWKRPGGFLGWSGAMIVGIQPHDMILMTCWGGGACTRAPCNRSDASLHYTRGMASASF